MLTECCNKTNVGETGCLGTSMNPSKIYEVSKSSSLTTSRLSPKCPVWSSAGVKYASLLPQGWNSLETCPRDKGESPPWSAYCTKTPFSLLPMNPRESHIFQVARLLWCVVSHGTTYPLKTWQFSSLEKLLTFSGKFHVFFHSLPQAQPVTP